MNKELQKEAKELLLVLRDHLQYVEDFSANNDDIFAYETSRINDFIDDMGAKV